MSITFPRYSFVQDASAPGPSDCYTGDPSFCLPCSSNANLQFQVVLQNIPYIPLNDTHGSDVYVAVVPPSFPCEYRSQDFTGTLMPMFNHLQKFIMGNHVEVTTPAVFYPATPGTARVFFDLASADFSALTITDNTWVPEIGDCFKLAIVWDSYIDEYQGIGWRTFFGCTGCFRRIAPDSCFSSVLRYQNPRFDDAFDFDYTYPSGGFMNKVELPIYLRDPVMNDDTKVYTRSDGSIVKLYERKEEQYTLETDLMPYTWLKALDIALSHDSVSIINTNAAAYDSINTAQHFQKKDNFEIEYQKGPLTALGKGTCKLLNANPVHLYNNNCA